MSITRTILQRIPLPQLSGWESRLVLLEFPPGVNGTLHTHPAPATGYVLEGDHISQWAGGEEEVYTAGDSFVDRKDELHVRTENTNQDKPLKLLLSYVIRVDEPNVVPCVEGEER